VVVLLMMLVSLTPFAKEASWQESMLVPHFQPLENWLSGFLPDSMQSHLELQKDQY
jgi:membrane protein required for colicin V production